MTTTTSGRTIPAGPPPAGATPSLTLVEMETPEGIAQNSAFTVTVKFTGNPAQPAWPIIRDSGAGTFKIELFAESVGGGPEPILTPAGGAVGALAAGVDAYNVPIAITVAQSSLLTVKGLYELGAVITFTNGAAVVANFAAYIGDALMLVH